ncbi:MAG TPA: DUF3108 domain-containing protein [Geobacter sp.]|nr:DUF3108 domain-containing protein [Geobacter sp.]
MQTHLHRIRPLAWCAMLSILVHLCLILSLRMLGSYDFGASVGNPLAVMVDLAAVSAAVGAQGATVKKAEPQKPELRTVAASLPEDGFEKGAAATRGREEVRPAPKPEAKPAAERLQSAAAPDDDMEEHKRAPRRHSGLRRRTPVVIDSPPAVPRPLPAVKPHRVLAADATPTMLNSVSESLASRYEKLTYLISMYGIPIGHAELESKSEMGVTVISLRVKSNAVISSYFPVDNLVETRHINGMFLVSNVKQNEGDFKCDQSFTINAAKKRVSFVDFRNSRTLDMDVPSGDVLDTLSGIYYLRNRQLEVGRTETLHIFDSETYADVPVEILRKEEMRLPNLAKVDTVVVRPLQTTPGIFRRTGDLLIWMTDDDKKVPVKIATSIPIGRVTAELISAESQPHIAASDPHIAASDPQQGR